MNAALEQLILQTAESLPAHSGPEEIAYHVAQNTPAADMRDYYRELLVGTVRTVINRANRAEKPRPKPKPNPASDRPRPVPTPVPAPSGPAPSPKLQDRRSWWRQMCDKQVQVGAGAWKPLGDCTIDDLRVGVKERDAAIGRIEEQISDFRHLITLLTTHHVRTVAELPEQRDWKRAAS